MTEQLGFFELPKQPKPKRKLSKSNSCETCPLFSKKDRQLQPFGEFQRKGMIWGEAPGKVEDRTGQPFHPDAPAGGYLHEVSEKLGLDLYRDCIIINSADCFPTGSDGLGRKPTAREISCCWHRKQKALEEYKPQVILLLGDVAIESFYKHGGNRIAEAKVSRIRGLHAPDRQLKAWICHSYHPSYIIRGNRDLGHMFERDFATFIDILRQGRPTVEDHPEPVLLREYAQVIELLNRLHKVKLFAFDYETTSYRYFEGIHSICLVGVKYDNGPAQVFPLDMLQGGELWWSQRDRLEIIKAWKEVLENPRIGKICQNTKHEILASKLVLGIDVNGIVHDTMTSCHVLNAGSPTGLKAQVYFQFGVEDYSKEVQKYMESEPRERNTLPTAPIEPAAKYCGLDAHFTYKLAARQQRLAKVTGLSTVDQLFLEGQQSFAAIERNGIRIDVAAAQEMNTQAIGQLEDLRKGIFASAEAKLFKRKTGRELSFAAKLSDADLRTLLFDILKLEPLHKGTTAYSVDEETLTAYADQVDLVKYEMEYRKVYKFSNTYISQLLRLQKDGFLYPSFNLNVAKSGRSASSDPNFQNIPKRQESMAEIRRLFIPRDNHKIAEADYSSMEVRVLACASHDETLIEYIKTGHDFHAYWAEKLFDIKKSDVEKDEFKKLRYNAKSNLVFALFYGSYYKSIAARVQRPKHIRSYRAWEDHVRDVEQEFWRMFEGVRKWQDWMTKQYVRNGYVQDNAWGFRRSGYLTRNMIYNTTIQGAAFHCLLWTINEMWKRGMINDPSTLLCGQIHDALFFDVACDKVQELRKQVDQIMTRDIVERNPWIIVPLATEWAVGDNWLEMKTLM